jgi:hypothetical protein
MATTHGAITIDAAGPVRIQASGAVSVSGAETISVTSTQGIELASGSAIRTAGSAVLSTTGTASPANIVLGGVVESGSGSITTGGSLSNVSQSGTLRVTGGTLSVTSPAFIQTGLVELASEATLRRTAGMTNQGLVIGSGTLDVGSGTLTNQGTLAPGGFGVPGRLNVTGHLTLGSQSMLDFDVGGTLAGTQHDQLAVSGSAALGGTLSVSTINGYPTESGSTFSLLSAVNSPTGIFAVRSLPANAAGVVSGPSYRMSLLEACAGVCWDGEGGTDTSWTNPLNWTGDQLPGTLSVAYINSPTAVVTLAGSGFTIKGLNTTAGSSLTLGSGASLTLGDALTTSTLAGNLSLNGGRLTAQGAGFVVGGGVNLAGGTLSVALATSAMASLGNVQLSAGQLSLSGQSSASVLQQNGGTLANAGTLALSGAGPVPSVHSWSGGVWTGGGLVSLQPQGSLDLSAPTTLAGQRLDIASSARASVRAITTVTQGQNAITTASGGTLQLAPASNRTVGFGVSGNGTLNVLNGGVLEVLGSGGTTDRGAIWTNFDTGTARVSLDSAGGTITVGSTGTPVAFELNQNNPERPVTGTVSALQVAAGSTLRNADGGMFIDAASGNFKLDGTLDTAGKALTTLNVGSLNAMVGALRIKDGTLSLMGAGPGSVSTDSFTQDSGTLHNTLTLKLKPGSPQANHLWAGGVWKGDGTVSLEGGGPGSGTLEFGPFVKLSGQHLDIGPSALARVTGFVVTSEGQNSIHTKPGGTLRIELPGGDADRGLSAQRTGTLDVVNQGLLQVLANPGSPSTGWGFLESTGSASSITLTSSGILQVGTADAPAKLELLQVAGSARGLLTGPLSVSPGSTLRVTKGDLDITADPAAFAFDGTLQMLGGYARLDTGTLSATVGKLSLLPSGSVPGVLHLAGAAGGSLTLGALEQDGNVLENAHHLVLASGGLGHSAANGLWNGAGTVTLASGGSLTLRDIGLMGGQGLKLQSSSSTTVLPGLLTSDGIWVDGNSTLQIEPTALLALDNQGINARLLSVSGGTLSVLSSGTLRSAGTGLTEIQASTDGLNRGTIILNSDSDSTVQVQAGDLRFSSATPGEGTHTDVVINGALNVSSGSSLETKDAHVALHPARNVPLAMDGTLRVDGGTTSVNVGSFDTTIGALHIQNGTLALSGTGSVSTNAFTQTGGKLDNPLNLALNGGQATSAHSWSMGTWTGGGTVNLQPYASLDLAGNPRMAGQHLNIGSLATATVNGIVYVPEGHNTVSTSAGGTLQILLPSGYQNRGFSVQESGRLDISNQGLLQVLGNSGSSSLGWGFLDSIGDSSALFLDSPGSIEVGTDGAAARLQLLQASGAVTGIVRGDLSVTPGSTLSIASYAGPGNQSASLNLQAQGASPLSIDGLLSVVGGTLAASGAGIRLASLDLQSGVLTGTAACAEGSPRSPTTRARPTVAESAVDRRAKRWFTKSPRLRD